MFFLYFVYRSYFRSTFSSYFFYFINYVHWQIHLSVQYTFSLHRLLYSLYNVHYTEKRNTKSTILIQITIIMNNKSNAYQLLPPPLLLLLLLLSAQIVLFYSGNFRYFSSCLILTRTKKKIYITLRAHHGSTLALLCCSIFLIASCLVFAHKLLWLTVVALWTFQ